MKLPLSQQTLQTQSYILSLCSKYAYLDEIEGIKKFCELNFAAELIDYNESQIYILNNGSELVIVCRGTEPTEFKDIQADLQLKMTSALIGNGKVHEGFQKSVFNIWQTLSKRLRYNKTKTLYCTGHSLGAAMATIIAYYLQNDPDMPTPKAIFSYGSPKVGNSIYIDEIKVEHYRFVNNADIVTRLPTWPYSHCGIIYYMNHWGNIRKLTWAQSIKDIWRGFFKGLEVHEINFFTNHFIDRYCNNLERWSLNIERLQT